MEKRVEALEIRLKELEERVGELKRANERGSISSETADRVFRAALGLLSGQDLQTWFREVRRQSLASSLVGLQGPLLARVAANLSSNAWNDLIEELRDQGIHGQHWTTSARNSMVHELDKLMEMGEVSNVEVWRTFGFEELPPFPHRPPLTDEEICLLNEKKAREEQEYWDWLREEMLPARKAR